MAEADIITPTPETRKRDKFLLLSQRRVEQAEQVLRLMGNLSTHSYDWDPKEVRAMFARVRKAADAAEARFHRSQRWN